MWINLRKWWVSFHPLYCKYQSGNLLFPPPFLYLNVHTSTVQGGVNSEVDGTGCDTGIIVVDEQRVVGDLVPSCPPAHDHLIGVDLTMQLVHVLGEVQLHCNLECRRIAYKFKGKICSLINSVSIILIFRRTVYMFVLPCKGFNSISTSSSLTSIEGSKSLG